MCRLGYKLQISGLVQGVGFRPLVFELASELGLHGEVKNDGFGVEIILACTKEECENFIYKLKEKLPPLARIDSIDITEQTTTNYIHFSIGTSLQNAKTTQCLVILHFAKSVKKIFDEKIRVFISFYHLYALWAKI